MSPLEESHISAMKKQIRKNTEALEASNMSDKPAKRSLEIVDEADVWPGGFEEELGRKMSESMSALVFAAAHDFRGQRSRIHDDRDSGQPSNGKNNDYRNGASTLASWNARKVEDDTFAVDNGPAYGVKEASPGFESPGPMHRFCFSTHIFSRE